MLTNIFKHQVKWLGSSPTAKIIFMHVPKTGGSSVDQALSKAYGKKHSFKDDPILTSRAVKAIAPDASADRGLTKFQVRESLLLCELAKGTPYISGHFHFNPQIWQAYQHQYAWITVLRDPVQRYISQYFFDAHKPEDHARVSERLEDFVHSQRGQLRGQNYINYFGNFDRHQEIDPDERLAVAKANLSKFAAIGFLDDLPTFTDDLAQKFRLTVRVPHVNKNPIAKPHISDAMRQQIATICQHDSDFYRYAQAQFAAVKAGR